MKDIEKEIKLKVKNFPKLISYLEKHGAIFLNKSKQKTVRFEKPNGELRKKGFFLRVRSGEKNIITLKEKIKSNKKVKVRKETEFEIKDVDKMTYILQKLGFNYLCIMEKFRINLKYKDAILSIDEIPFGIYLEIEGTEKQIDTISQELGYKPEERILLTYWELLKEYNQEHKTNKKNIIFPKSYISKILNY
jgi:adenylate cyclase, class 2